MKKEVKTYSVNDYKENKVIRPIDFIIYEEVTAGSIIAQYPVSAYSVRGANYPDPELYKHQSKNDFSEFDPYDWWFMRMYKVIKVNDDNDILYLAGVSAEATGEFEGYNINSPLSTLFINSDSAFTMKRSQLVRDRTWWLITEVLE